MDWNANELMSMSIVVCGDSGVVFVLGLSLSDVMLCLERKKSVVCMTGNEEQERRERD
jgi:hypothetical protein